MASHAVAWKELPLQFISGVEVGVLILLYFILRPFIDFRSKFNLVLTTVITTLVVTPSTWFPIFFTYEHPDWSWKATFSNTYSTLVRSGIVSLSCFLLLRWDIPTIYFEEPSKRKERIRKFVPPVVTWAVVMAIIFAEHGGLSADNKVLLLTTLPFLTILWIGGGNYMCKRWKTTLLLVGIPTVALSIHSQDVIALLKNLVTVSIAVFTFNSIERCYMILHSFPGLFNRTQWIVTNMLKASTICESDLPQEFIVDLKTSLSLVWKGKKGAKTFLISSMLSPYALRQDFFPLYQFFIIGDDIIDESSFSVDEKLHFISIQKEYMGTSRLDPHPKDDDHNGKEVAKLKNLSDGLKLFLTADEMSCFRCTEYYLANTHPFFKGVVKRALNDLQPKVVQELKKSYFKTEEDFLAHAKILSSNFIEIYLCLMKASVWIPSQDVEWMLTSDTEELGLSNANSASRKQLEEAVMHIGFYMQCLNVARDIIEDSLNGGRVFIPKSYFAEEQEIQHFYTLRKGDPLSVNSETLKKYALKLLDLGDRLLLRSGSRDFFIENVPREFQRHVYAGLELRMEIANTIRLNEAYIPHAGPSNFRVAWIILKCLYLPIKLMK